MRKYTVLNYDARGATAGFHEVDAQPFNYKHILQEALYELWRLLSEVRIDKKRKEALFRAEWELARLIGYPSFGSGNGAPVGVDELWLSIQRCTDAYDQRIQTLEAEVQEKEEAITGLTTGPWGLEATQTYWKSQQTNWQETERRLQDEINELERQRDETLKELTSLRQEMRKIEDTRYDAKMTLDKLEYIKRYFERHRSILVKESDIDFVKLLEKQEQQYVEELERERKQLASVKERYERRLAEEQKHNGKTDVIRLGEEKGKLQEEITRLKAELEEQRERADKAEQRNRHLGETTDRQLGERTKIIEQLQGEVEALQVEKKKLFPGEMSSLRSAAFFDYLHRMRVAIGLIEENANAEETKETTSPSTLSSWSVQLERRGVGALVYGYNTSDITDAYESLAYAIDQIKQNPEGSRVLPTDIVGGFASLFGYEYLYRYFLQVRPDTRDGRLFRLLLDFSVPTSKILGLVSDLQAAPWLANHPPPLSAMSNGESYIKSIGNQRLIGLAIAQDIIEYEQHNLLDFRKSLYLALRAIAPFTSKDGEGQENDNVLLEEHHLQIINYGQVVTDSDGLLVKEGCHIIQYEYSGSAISVRVPATLAFNNNGQLLSTEELEGLLGE